MTREVHSTGGTAWGKSAPHEGQSKKAQAWLREYMGSALPSVPLEALGESCFTEAPAPHSSASQQGAEAHAGASASAERNAEPAAAADRGDAALPTKPGASRMLDLKNIFDGIYLGDAPSAAAAPPALKLPGREPAGAAGKAPLRPPSTPGSDRLQAAGKRMSAEKALQRATLSDRPLSRSSSAHADRAAGGGTAGTPGGSGIPLTARNLVLKEKIEKEKSQTKKHPMASRPESVAVAGMDEEELEALAGAPPVAAHCHLIFYLCVAISIEWSRLPSACCCRCMRPVQ